ncbi:hypothetical protein [Achromobacter marplatensis]
MLQKLIKKSIEDKAIVRFVYGGHQRVVEPHVLGISRGVMQILGYQIEGSSSSGTLPEWRRFDLPGIVGMEVTGQTFSGRRPFPSGRHSSWDRQILIVGI